MAKFGRKKSKFLVLTENWNTYTHTHTHTHIYTHTYTHTLIYTHIEYLEDADSYFDMSFLKFQT